MIMQACRTIAGVCAVMLLAGCGTGYHAPEVQHVYTTSTQDYHTLSGLRIVCEPSPDALSNVVAGAVFGSREYTVFYVDGRTVLTTDGLHSAETFLQLPPGDHEIISADTVKGAVTLGSEVSKPTYRIKFTLGRNASATVYALTSIIQRIEGAESYEIVKGRQILGQTIVSQAPRKPLAVRMSDDDVETRLMRLKALRDKGLMSEESYQQRALEILSK